MLSSAALHDRDHLHILIVVFVGISFWLLSFGREAFSEVVEPPITEAKMQNMGLTVPPPPPVEPTEYDFKMRSLAKVPEPAPAKNAGIVTILSAEPPPEPMVTGPVTEPYDPPPVPDPTPIPAPASAPPSEPLTWPTAAARPLEGALVPYNRIVAYYGNFYSTGMGVLGEFSRDTVKRMLNKEVKAWEAADPETPVVPGIDYIAIVAQGGPGKDGMYRARMPYAEIDKAVSLAAEVNGIVILEVQAGLSDVLTEVKSLERYLLLPQVHLAIDPEFAMRKSGAKPGVRVGTVDAVEINAAIDYLTGLVNERSLPPKMLVIHRYTRPMVTGSWNIRPTPEVQVVMDMDGWGSKGAKYSTYQAYIQSEPVQFTGFKIFYKNDTKVPGTAVLTPQEVLALTPKPVFIQYQ